MPTKETETVTLSDGRVMSAADYAERMALLSKPFEADQIEKLPKQFKKDDPNKARCERGSRVSADGYFCGGYHAYAMHLDYVGHAGITDRLNQVDPLWNWEPMGLTPQGTPVFCDGGMWGKLTILGITRIGFGDANGKSGPSATKEIIGDFIRNAAMRFGVATYLWSKSEAAKKLAEGEPEEPAQQPAQQRPGIDWGEALEQAKGNPERLAALRATAKNAGAPDHYMAAVDKAIQEATPIEGALVDA